MGKLVTVKTGYSGVALPNKSGDGSIRDYKSGDTVTVTDAEYANFNAATLNAITLTTSGLPDPFRKSASTLGGVLSTGTFAAAAGGYVGVGTTVINAPATGVTYTNGWLQVPFDQPGAVPPVVGPKPGASFGLDVLHIQGATSASTAPTTKNWIGQVVRVDQAASNSAGYNTSIPGQTSASAGGVTTSSGSPTVLDSKIKASDYGNQVTGAGIPAGTFVGTVTPGVSFLLSSTSGSQTNVNATATATGVPITITANSVVKWPGGTVPTFTASANAIDLFRFVTFDGGVTWYSVFVVKGLN